MDNPSPDFVRYWSGSDAFSAVVVTGALDDDDASSASQRDALEALAERVAAARSVL